LPKQCILAPVDFSESSLEAATTALQMVEKPNQLRLIHVLPKITPTEPGIVWSTVDDASRIEHARKALLERLPSSVAKGSIIEIAIGDPGREIADYAQKISADLIVMPSHGRGGLSRLFLGSVAERVVRLAHCPVLVLKK
jgi:nucleotide-binding universal stress UspA family protein